MKIRVLLLSSLLLSVVGFVQGQERNVPTWADATFRVEGTTIIGPGSDEFLIKGVNVNGPGWCWSRDTLKDLELLIDVWKFNSIRLCACTVWGDRAAENNKDLDAIIKGFTERRIVVMLELHDYTGNWPPLENDGGYITTDSDHEIIRPLRDLKAWWGDKAERFKDNPYVWFNIMNEPGADDSKESADMWFKVHDIVIEAIRATGAKNIIVLDDHGWGQASGYIGGKESYASAVIRMGPAINKKHDNIVYSLHVYDGWTDGKKRFDRYFQDAKDLGLCVILGEFGVSGDNVWQYNAVKSMYDSAIPHNIGRMYWAWDDGGLPMTTGENGRGHAIDKKDGTKPGNLTWVGELVWLDNRGELTAPVPMYDLPLLLNGDFENGTRGWYVTHGGTVAPGTSHNGSAALTIGAGTSSSALQTLELEPNTTYSLKAWGKGNADVGIQYKVGEKDTKEHQKVLVFRTEEWVEKSLAFTTPNETYNRLFYIEKNDADATFQIDDIELKKVDGYK